MRIIPHSENRKLFRGCEQFERQAVDVIDRLEALEPGEASGWSWGWTIPSGMPNVELKGFVYVSNLNAEHGGSEKVFRDSIMT